MRSIRLFTLLLLTCAGAVLCAKEPNTVRRTLQEQLKRYPKMEIQDVYKFLYQATMGNEHFMGDEKEARRYLDEEYAQANAAEDGPEFEPLTADSSLVRVNLRPFKFHKRESGKLMEAMTRTAAGFRKNPALLKLYWNEVEQLAVETRIPYKPEELRAFFVRMEQENYPAVDHSKAYIEAYHPSYRVVLRSSLTK